MLATLNKYRAVFSVGLQSNLVYRVNFAIRGFFSFFHLIVVFILWTAAYTGSPVIGGFNFAQTFTYFVALIVVQFMIGAFNEDYQISEDIRNGLINQFLLKPVNYFAYRFSIYLSARLVTGLLILLPVIVTYPLLKDYLVVPPELWRLTLGLPALAMSALIQFGIAYCFGLMSFWFLEIQGLVILSMAIESVLVQVTALPSAVMPLIPVPNVRVCPIAVTPVPLMVAAGKPITTPAPDIVRAVAAGLM